MGACPDAHLPLQAILSFCISLTLTDGINWEGVGSEHQVKSEVTRCSWASCTGTCRLFSRHIPKVSLSQGVAEWNPGPSARDTPCPGDTGFCSHPLCLSTKDLQLAAPLALKADRHKPSVVHHHHHYPPMGVFPVPPQSFLPTSTAQHWTGSSAQPG